MSQLPDLFQELLVVRGFTDAKTIKAFLHPDYNSLADPFLLPDMSEAVERIKQAKATQEKIIIYGDYDIDGLSATALLYSALKTFGLEVDTFIPSRFHDGYGLSEDAVKRIAKAGASLLITVDCGSSSISEVAYAKENGLDVIITDHHNLGDTLPDAVAVINPKRPEHSYPFRDFSGAGVAFNLVRALQAKMPGMDKGQEKWLLDLAALGTVCDVVSLKDENRVLAHWGLEVMKQTRRPGLKALMAVADIDPKRLTTRSLGFGLGPRLNASGRLETAQTSLELLLVSDHQEALRSAQVLQNMNMSRQTQQKKIVKEAKDQAMKYSADDVLVVNHADWNHGIIGIVAAKLLETYHKPTFILQEMGLESKGSARSFGDFSLSAAIKKNKKLLISGGGHDAAAGISLLTEDIDAFRQAINSYYRTLNLKDQANFFIPKADLELTALEGLNETLVEKIAQLEPFGNNNPQPIFCIQSLSVASVRRMGNENQHVKLKLRDHNGADMEFLAFSAPTHFFAEPGDNVTVWCTLDINEWQGNRTVEGRLLELVRAEPVPKD